MQIQIIKKRAVKAANASAVTMPGITAAETFCLSLLSSLELDLLTEELALKLPGRIATDKNIVNDLSDSYKKADLIRAFLVIDGHGFPTVQFRFCRCFEKSHFFLFEIGFHPQNGEALRYARMAFTPPLRSVK